MSEEEKTTHAELIEEIISRKLKPVYWAVAAMLGIFISVSGPLTFKTIDLSVMINGCIQSEEAYRNFLPKNSYHQLQKDEHITDIEAIRNPEQSDLIYMKHNSLEAEKLDIRYRGTTK